MKRTIVLELLLIVMFAVGCGNNSNIKAESENNVEMENGIKMTDEQKELLKKISMNEENIEVGILYEWQKEVLHQYDFAMKYLKEKYPSHEFQIVDCSQKNKLNSYTTFWFTADNSETRYEMYIDIEEETVTYSGRDTFFGSLVQDAYAKILAEYIQKTMPECIGCDTYMGSAVGTEFDEKKTADDIFNGGYQIMNDTEIFVNGVLGEQPEKYADRIEKIIKNKALYGAYVVYVLSKLPDTTVSAEKLADYVKDRDNLEIFRKTFQYFGD